MSQSLWEKVTDQLEWLHYEIKDYAFFTEAMSSRFCWNKIIMNLDNDPDRFNCNGNGCVVSTVKYSSKQ